MLLPPIRRRSTHKIPWQDPPLNHMVEHMNTIRPALIAPLLLLLAATAAPAQDAERAAHGDEASSPQVAFEQKGKDHVLRQYQLGCLSHLSYLLVSGQDAAVIDPQRDVEHYLRDAEALGATVRHVLLTHNHADFVAGHTELRHRTGAGIAISALAQAEFEHRALRDGDRVTVGKVTVEAWQTPGHTPNAMTFLVRAPGAGADPAYALTGDTLFIGGIGRPDLLDVPPAELASQSFDSVQRLKTLPDATLVLPAHGAGSLCGAHLSPETTSTIGAEKRSNPYLQISSRATFVANVISHQPVAPQYFAHNVEMNRKGPPLVEKTATLPLALTPAQAKAALEGGAWVVDVRDQREYAAAHLASAVNVALRGRLDTWTGIVVPFGSDLLLVGGDEEIAEGAFRLRRIGYDRIAGRLAPDAAAWRQAGLDVRTSRLVTSQELHEQMRAGREPIVVDVRTADEYADLRIGEVGNIPVTEHVRFAQTLDKAQPVLFLCNSAYRSSMAVGLAERQGFTDVASLDGGMDAWLSAGLPAVGRQAQTTAAAGGIVLPEPVDPALLARVLLDQPQTYAVLDLRPGWQFAEWRIPGSANVTLDQLEARIAALPTGTRIVLVDRDGTVAFAAAGALLARNPERTLRALLGGVQRYFREIELGQSGGSGAPMPTGAAAPPAAATTTPKKRSAGC